MIADPNDDVLNGVRVLVVEDEAAISMLLEDMLLDFGCAVVGPAARLSSALEMASQEAFEVAILDVNVAGEPIYPVAEAIAKRTTRQLYDKVAERTRERGDGPRAGQGARQPRGRQPDHLAHRPRGGFR